MRNISNKIIFVIIFFAGFWTINSCNKKKALDSKIEEYKLPWDTKFISYSNMKFGSHGCAFKIFYKDSLIKFVSKDFDCPTIVDSFILNNQILYLQCDFQAISTFYVFYTKNGGNTWKQEIIGPHYLTKTHIVNPNLIYFVTSNGPILFFTGIDQSNLKVYKDTLTSGVHYITDLGANTDLDSTIININDTVQYVILFK